MMSRRRWVLSGVVLLIGALAAIRVTLLSGDAATPARPAGGAGGGPIPVAILVARSEAMTDRVAVIGTIRANEEVQIRSEVSGRIDQVRFQEGSRVARGDLLLKVNDSELQAQMARAKARQAIGESEAERQRLLFKNGLTSEREHSVAVNEADVARAEVDLIRAQLAKTEIRAPFSGVIGLRSVSEGSYLTPATLIASIQDHTPVKIEFAVPERYAGRIFPGDRITFTVAGHATTFTGTVYAREAAIDAVTRTLRVRATSPNDDGALIPGGFANVEVAFGKRDGILVPSFAVVPELNGHRVFVLRSGKAEARNVEIGTRTDDRIEVVRGLAPGDTVITSAILQLRDGAPVQASGGE
jgi:membrane fusion protein (multidrug efflux system)